MQKSDDGAWTLADAEAGDIDTLVGDVLFNLNYLRMEGVVAEPEPGADIALAPFGLEAPAMGVRLFVGDEEVANLSVGDEVPADQLGELPQFAPETQTYATVDGTPGVFRLDAEVRDNLQAILDQAS